MNKTQDLLEARVGQLRITRSRFHYKPITPIELVLTTALSVSIGVGMFVLATAIDVPQNNLDRQAQLKIVRDASF